MRSSLADDTHAHRHRRLRWFVPAMVLASITSFANLAHAQWHTDSRDYMGTRVRVEVWSEDVAAARAGIAAVMAEMQRIERMMSPQVAASDLSRLNREGARGPVVVPAELFEVVERSLAVSRLSNGAFDVTFASVGRFYDYRERRRPSSAELARALPAIDYRHLQLDAAQRSIAFAHPGVMVDLGGIAKGYAVDRGIAILRERGFAEMLVNAGGDSRIVGDRHGKPWVIGIKNPRGATRGAMRGGERGDDAPIAVLPLANVAMSTSGDYERFFEEGGERYHHIIDPRTGDSARALQSVTILGDEAIWTDALSTTVFVLGPEKGMALIDSLGNVDAVIVDGKGELHYSRSLTDARALRGASADQRDDAGHQ